ncbi:MAG: hypothetical protein WCX31_12325 [Salinivirgaceae bacterium]|jgi:hypothetical protein
MQRIYLFFIGGLVILMFLLLWGCTFNSEEEYFEKTECDTTGLVYEDLTYIFTDVCARCHYQGNPYRSDIVMDSYEAIKTSINTGLVIPAIHHEGDLTPMPYKEPKLSDCNRDKIEAWVEAGMPKRAK